MLHKLFLILNPIWKSLWVKQTYSSSLHSAFWAICIGWAEALQKMLPGGYAKFLTEWLPCFFLSLNLQAILIYLSEKPDVNDWSFCECFQQPWAFCQYLIEANYSSEFWVKELASLLIKSKIENALGLLEAFKAERSIKVIWQWLSCHGRKSTWKVWR